MDESTHTGNEIAIGDLYEIREGVPTMPGSKWIPTEGQEFRDFRDRKIELSEGEKKQLGFDTNLILSRSISPSDRNQQNAGLVVGQIQSGKTLSMTGLAALAHDNNFPLVIILTGTARNLYNQNVERIFEDLDIK